MATIPSIAMIPSGVKASKLYSVLPTDGAGDFTTTRASVATRVNENGLIEEVAANVPRLDYSDGTCPSLLLEGTATNLITYSEDFSNAYWTKFGTPTIDITSIISPDGTLNGTKVTRGSFITPLRRSNLTTLGTEYTFSLYAKKGSVDTMTLDIGDETTPQFTLTDEWQRFEVTSIPNTSTHVDISFGASVSGDSFYIWGAQLEENSYATSYIKTVGTAQTRVADTASGSGSSTVINSSEGVLYAEISVDEDIDVNLNITLSTGVHEENLVKIIYIPSETQLKAQIYGANNTILTTVSYASFALGQYNKVAVSYSPTLLNLYVNGSQVASTSVNGSPVGLNSLSFDRADGAGNFYGKTKSLQVYTTALSDAELISLTTI